MFDRAILKLKARDQFRRLITIVTAKIKINMLAQWLEIQQNKIKFIVQWNIAIRAMYVKLKGESFFWVKYLKERERVMSFMYCYSSLVVDTMIRLCK